MTDPRPPPPTTIGATPTSDYSNGNTEIGMKSLVVLVAGLAAVATAQEQLYADPAAAAVPGAADYYSGE